MTPEEMEAEGRREIEYRISEMGESIGAADTKVFVVYPSGYGIRKVG
jgi:hypothetical protein